MTDAVSSLIAWHDVVPIEGQPHARTPAGVTQALLGPDGGPLDLSGLPGWRARGLLSLGQGSAALLDLIAPDGSTLGWWFGPDNRLAATAADQVPAALGDAIKAALTPLLTDLVRHCSAAARPDGAALLALSAPLRLDLIRHFGRLPALPAIDVLPALPAVDVLPRLPSSAPVVTAEGKTIPQILPDQLARFLAIDWFSHIRAAFALGHVAVPCLGQPGETRDVRFIPIDVERHLLQVRDSAGGLVWSALLYVTYGQSHCLALCLDDAGLILAPRAGGLAELPKAISSARRILIERLIAAGPALLPWTRSLSGLAMTSRPVSRNEIGHLIWNVMSGVLHMVEATSADTAPAPFYDMPAAEGSEIYGPIEDIFPELIGHVRKHANSLTTAFADAVAHGRMIVPFMGREVPTRLRRRIIAAVDRDPMINTCLKPATPALLGEVDGHRPPVLALGLRLQNRVMPDLLDFYVELTRKLLEVTPEGRLAIVFDGINGANRPGAFTIAGGSDVTGMMAREQAFVEAYQAATAGLPLSVVNCVGMPMRANLYWLGFADFVVSPYGGGLTKYRWVHNIPGFILTGSQNLRFSKWLNIYGPNGPNPDKNGNVEDAAPLHYTNRDEVRDLYPADQQFKPNGRSIGGWRGHLTPLNFELVDRSATLSRIANLFGHTISAKGSISLGSR